VLSRLGSETAPASEIEMPGGGAAKLRVEPYRLGGVDCDEFLLLLSDPEVIDSLETDVRLANQLQGLARAYRTMAHELRAPLGAMMIHLDLLRESIVFGTVATGKEGPERYVVVLREELQRLNRSLSEVLTGALSATEHRARFDLREALSEVGTLLAPQSRRQGVDLRSRTPEMPVILVGYRDRLKQSFLNIAVNALEAMPGGGCLSFDMQVEDAVAVVRVSDTGRGIPREDLERIYERDFTTKATGSGIGLHVARALVEIHGGVIRVESEEGRGTLVEVRLPLLPRD
jgi:signal transduction histidine kinase